MNPPTIDSPLASNAYSAGERMLLAMRIITHPNISLSERHVSGIQDAATPEKNVVQSLFLHKASRSHYQNAPGGEVFLSIPMMRAMLELAQTYQYRVSEISGGSHSHRSRHYAGVAMDVDVINHQPVSATNHFVSGFMLKCKTLGATEVLGPGSPGHGSHVHAGWPRPTSG